MSPDPAQSGKAARNTLGVFATRLALYPVSLGVSILVARALGPADRGIYSFLLLFPSFVLPLGTLGFGASVIYFLSRKTYAAKEVAMTCALVGAAQGLACAVVILGLMALGLLGETARRTPPELLLGVLAILPIQGAGWTLGRMLLGTSWFAANNLITLLGPLLTALGMVILVGLLNLGLKGAVVVFLATTVITSATTLTLVWMRYKPVVGFDWRFARESLRYGMKAWLGDLAIRANLRFDQLLLGIFAAPAALGTYSVAVSISELLWLIPDSLALVTFNKLAAEKSDSGRIRLLGSIHRSLWLVVAVAALGLGLVGWWIIPRVYGEGFSQASKYLALLLPGTVLMTTSKVLTKYFGAIGKPGSSSMIQMVGAAVSLTGYGLLIPRFGATAAAVVSVLGYGAAAATALWMYRNTIRPARPALFDFGLGDLQWVAGQLRSARIRRQPRSL